MANTPYLSIIVPVYNASTYLRDCIDSILAQKVANTDTTTAETFSDYELILVDDGSTDQSGAICDEYAAHTDRIVVIHQPNQGHTAARQAGFKAAHGTYIAFVDSDDQVAPEMYSHMTALAKETNADIIHCDFEAVMPTKRKVCDTPFKPGLYSKDKLLTDIYPQLIYSGTFFTFGAAPNIWNKLFKKDLLNQNLFAIPHEILNGEDLLLTYSCMLQADSVYFIDKPYYYYYSRPASMCRTVDLDRLRRNYVLFESMNRMLDTDKYPMLKNQIHYYTVYQMLLYALPVMHDMKQTSHSVKNMRSLCKEMLSNPQIHDAFRFVKTASVTGMRNRMFVLGIKLHFFPLLWIAALKNA